MKAMSEIDQPTNSDTEAPINKSQPDRRSINLNDLITVEKWSIPKAQVHTAIWVIDSRITYSHLEVDEAKKLYKTYYDYSSDDEDFGRHVHEFNCEEEDSSVEFKHGTVMCKILSKMSSNQTKIYFVKVPELGQQTEHILHGLNYIFYQSKKLKTKYNIVVMTLGSEKFSAGNIRFPKEETATIPEIHDYPTSFFQGCRLCLVVGAHSINTSNEACIPSTFLSDGCCALDQEGATYNDFKQGILTWAIGEGLIIPKVKNIKSDAIVGGTSVATAVVGATATILLPKLVEMTGKRSLDKKEYSKKLKMHIERNSDVYVCLKHEISRNLIFNIERCMDILGYKKILPKEKTPQR